MTFSIRLKSNMEARLEQLATSTGRAKAFYVNASLEHGLSIDKLEEMYLPAHLKNGAEAENRGQDFGKGFNLGVSQLNLV